MKRFLCAVLFLAILLTVVSCGSSPVTPLPDAEDVQAMPLPTPVTVQEASGAGADDGRLRLSVIVPKEARGFASEAARMAEARAEQLSDEVSFFRADCSSGEEMAAALRAAAARKDDAVLLYPGFEGVEEAAQQVIDAGAVLVSLDLPLACEGAYRIRGDDSALGTAAADFAASRLSADSDVAVLVPEVEDAQALDRAEAFCEELRAASPGTHVYEYATGSTREECRITFAALLYGEIELECVFVPNDELASGVLTALEEARRDDVGLVLSCGGKQEYLKALRDSKSRTLASAVYAPFLGSKAVDFALEILAGGAVDPVRVLPAEIVQRLNCAPYIMEESRY